ncbi:hypothetical protein AKO1_008436 [Acrasis kona]|uniref:Uncharacterized protein n=1 Tax=Acrasis kona TaxID=1008807 RepID=A0AAW2YMJ2_9EUKA
MLLSTATQDNDFFDTISLYESDKPIVMQKFKRIFRGRGQEVSLRATIPKSNYMTTEIIPISLEVSNRTNFNMHRFDIVLTQVDMSGGFTKKWERHTSGCVEKGCLQTLIKFQIPKDLMIGPDIVTTLSIKGIMSMHRDLVAWSFINVSK